MGLLNTLMLSCRKATELMERSTMQPLPMGDRMRLWMHRRACDGCRAFEKQNAAMDQLLEKRPERAVDARALEGRILQALERDEE
ncbi:MAG: hypothetical protein WEC15_00520 [Flavobacteriales bacterium]